MATKADTLRDKLRHELIALRTCQNAPGYDDDVDIECRIKTVIKELMRCERKARYERWAGPPPYHTEEEDCMFNLKLTNCYREEGGKWIDATDVTVSYARKLLAEYQAAEPGNDWHLETRGTSADWHRMT